MYTLPASQRHVGGCPQRQHALVNPVFGGARDVPRPVASAPEPVYPAPSDFPAQCLRHHLGCPAPDSKAVPAQALDHFGNGRRSMDGQVQGEHVSKLNSMQLSGHGRTFPCGSDIGQGCRYEAGRRVSPRADTRVADVTYPASDNAMPSKMSCSLTVSWSMPARSRSSRANSSTTIAPPPITSARPGCIGASAARCLRVMPISRWQTSSRSAPGTRER